MIAVASHTRRNMRGSLDGFSLSRVVSSVTSPVRQLVSEIADPVEDLAQRVGAEGQRTLDNAQELSERVAEFGKDFIGANGLDFDEIAEEMGLADGVASIIDGTNPWIDKIDRQIAIAQRAILERPRNLGQPEPAPDPNAIPDVSTFGTKSFIDSPAGQLGLNILNFAGPIGGLVQVGVRILGAFGASKGREETQERFILIKNRLDEIFLVHGRRVDRAVDVLAFLGDPDALAVRGFSIEQQEQESSRRTRRNVLIAAGAGGAGLILFRTFLGGFTSFGSSFSFTDTLAERMARIRAGEIPIGTPEDPAPFPPPPPPAPPPIVERTPPAAPAPRTPGALNPADNLGLPPISRLVNKSNELDEKTNTLLSLLDELGVKIGPDVKISGPTDLSGRVFGAVGLGLLASATLIFIARRL